MNTRKVVLAIFVVLIALGFSIPGANAQPESDLWLLLPAVDEDGNLDPEDGAYFETRSLDSENRELIICHGEVINDSGKAYIVNPCSIAVPEDTWCIIGSLVISASGRAHILGEFQSECEDLYIPSCYQ